MNKEHTNLGVLVSGLKNYIIRNREIVVYGIVGVLTTVVSWLSSFILKLFLDDQIALQNLVINSLSWIAAIAFAYPTNRLFVFESKNSNILQECAEFVGSRIATGVAEVGLMSLLVNALHVNFWISKLLVSVIVIIANYILSKLIVFQAKG